MRGGSRQRAGPAPGESNSARLLTPGRSPLPALTCQSAGRILTCMADEYRVPKREVTAEVTIAGQKPAALRLYLAGQAAHHAGYERPSDLLNGPDPFFPVTDRKGRLVLLQRDAVVTMSVPAEDEQNVDDDPDAVVVSLSTDRVEVSLDNGASLKGLVEFVMPEGRRRLVDFLNLGERFLAVRENGTIHLINKSRIARIAVTKAA